MHFKLIFELIFSNKVTPVIFDYDINSYDLKKIINTW